MASRACGLILTLFTSAVLSRDCIELTISDKRIITETILNSTILKFQHENDTVVESSRFNIVQLWERFPKVVVPRNGTSEQCRRDSQLYMDSLDRLELWALKSKFCFYFIFFSSHSYAKQKKKFIQITHLRIHFTTKDNPRLKHCCFKFKTMIRLLDL